MDILGEFCRRLLPAVPILAMMLLTPGPVPQAQERQAPGKGVRVPLLFSPEARAGQAIYRARCAKCHGKNMEGTNSAPSLIVYDRSHHPDGVIAKSIRSGAGQHHWEFGNMPAAKGLTDKEIEQIIRFVREMQDHNAEPENNR